MQPVKTVMVGSMATGKSSMVLMAIQRVFRQTQSTTGALYYKKTVCVRDHDVPLAIWDTAGQEKFRSLSRMYYRSANVFVLVFDLARPGTLDECTEWLATIRENCTQPSHRVILVGNKLDAEHSAETSAAGARFAQEHGLVYVETSCKTGEGVERVFEEAATYALDAGLLNGAPVDARAALSIPDERRRRGRCC